MRINLAPQINPGMRITALSRDGDTLSLQWRVKTEDRSADLDFSDLTEGALLPADAIPCPLVSGPVERIDGVLHFAALDYPVAANAPESTRGTPNRVDVDGEIIPGKPTPVLELDEDGPADLPPADAAPLAAPAWSDPKQRVQEDAP